MDNREIRIAVAEACGWTEVHMTAQGLAGFPACGDDDDDCWSGSPPNYPEDLNACSDFEDLVIGAGMAGGDWDVKYFKALSSICQGRPAWSARARDRCQAFLLTKGLWK